MIAVFQSALVMLKIERGEMILFICINANWWWYAQTQELSTRSEKSDDGADLVTRDIDAGYNSDLDLDVAPVSPLDPMDEIEQIESVVAASRKNSPLASESHAGHILLDQGIWKNKLSLHDLHTWSWNIVPLFDS